MSAHARLKVFWYKSMWFGKPYYTVSKSKGKSVLNISPTNWRLNVQWRPPCPRQQCPLLSTSLTTLSRLSFLILIHPSHHRKPLDLVEHLPSFQLLSELAAMLLSKSHPTAREHRLAPSRMWQHCAISRVPHVTAPPPPPRNTTVSFTHAQLLPLNLCVHKGFWVADNSNCQSRVTLAGRITPRYIWYSDLWIS